MKDNLETKKNYRSMLSLKIDNIENKFSSISSYSSEYIVINEKKLFLPLCLLGKEIYNWKFINPKKINLNIIISVLSKFFEINKVKSDIILIGLTKYNLKDFLYLKKDCDKKKIPLDIMDYGSACRTFNILKNEGRNLITILI